jgi:tetratricopeptide (TPR) repeat protein
MTETTSEEQVPEPLLEARRLLDEGMLELCLATLKPYWLKNELDTRAIGMFGELMNEAGRNEVARKLKRLTQLLDAQANNDSPEAAATPEAVEKKSDGGANSEQEPSRDDIPYALFEAGFGLIDLRQHELAVMLLERCLKLMPNEPTVNYEIAFSLMSLARFDEAIKHFKFVLQDNEDFDTVLNLSVCYTLTRNIAEARKMIEKLATLTHEEDEQRELQHRRLVLKRLELLNTKQTFTPRDWQFVLYGGILLRTGNDHVHQREDIMSIASTLAILKGLFEGLRIEFEAVEYYNPNARPLARILAELMEIPCDSYKGPHRPDRALLILAWATDIIGPHQAFIEHMQSRSVFAYGLTWHEPLPVAPEIAGLLADDTVMPWEESRPESIDDMVAKILERARDLDCDPDILKETQEAVEYYDSKRELLVLNNWTTFPDRPEYTAEVQRPQAAKQ